jgi:fucose 4-O-acetylase-like acetyltransferase
MRRVAPPSFNSLIGRFAPAAARAEGADAVVGVRTPANTAGIRALERVGYLDVAKGIGIILVVVGHAIGGLRSSNLTSDRSSLEFFFYLIYSFHMPLFFFLSALFVERRIRQSPRRFGLSILTRIAYPYFLWGTVQISVEFLTSGLLNHPMTFSSADQLFSILWAPPAQFWFLYSLFFLHLIALIAFRINGSTAFVLTLAIIFAACAASPGLREFITGYVTGTDILFYGLGACVGSSLLQWRGNIGRGYGLILIASILFGSLVGVGWQREIPLNTYAMLPAAFAGTALVLVLSASDTLRDNKVLAYLGRRALSIYVLHVFFVAGTRIALVKGAHVSDLGIVLPVIVLMGLIAPLAIDRVARSLRLSAQLGLP